MVNKTIKKAATSNFSAPSIFSLERCISPSDGVLYGTNWEEKNDSANWMPLQVKEITIRGTVSHRMEDNKVSAETSQPQPHSIDSCYLSPHHNTVALSFTVKFLGDLEHPSACNDPEYSKRFNSLVKDYIDRTGLKELSLRYAYNIANARFLWRNRLGAEKLEVQVKINNNPNILVFDSYNYSMREFTHEANDEQLISLANAISDALTGKIPFLLLDITAFAELGRGQQVYPSEDMHLFPKKDNGKEKSPDSNKKAKFLYTVNDTAGIHPQKIGNAIRTVDTWYPDYFEIDHGPIAAETYGAVTTLGRAFRGNSSSFYKLFDKYMAAGSFPEGPESDYIMAVLIRGGLLQKNKTKKDTQGEGAAE